MKKIKFIPFYSLFMVCLLLFLNSCNNEKPLTPPIDTEYQFDSARYEWKTDTLPYQYAGEIFGFDSSHIYIIDNHSLIRI